MDNKEVTQKDNVEEVKTTMVDHVRIVDVASGKELLNKRG